MRLPIPIGRHALPMAAVSAGEARSSQGLASFSLEAAPLSDPIREPATLPVVVNFCRSSKLVRLRIAPVPAVRCVSAGPAKGSVFQKVSRFVRRFHVRLNRMGHEQCGQQKLRNGSPK